MRTVVRSVTCRAVSILASSLEVSACRRRVRRNSESRGVVRLVVVVEVVSSWPNASFRLSSSMSESWSRLEERSTSRSAMVVLYVPWTSSELSNQNSSLSSCQFLNSLSIFRFFPPLVPRSIGLVTFIASLSPSPGPRTTLFYALCFLLPLDVVLFSSSSSFFVTTGYSPPCKRERSSPSSNLLPTRLCLKAAVVAAR